MDTVESPKFTIVIPTRERADVLRYSLATACAQDYVNLQILVSDNSSTDNTSEVVRCFRDPRIKYINTGKRVSMSHNWEFALEHIDSGWVTFLGDDDAILPGAIQKVIEIANKTGVQAVRSNGCSYAWPQLVGSSYGRLSVSLKKNWLVLDSKVMLAKVMNGEAPYYKLPMLYNGGFMDVSLIKKAKSITNDFFMSMTPDVYSAIAFSLLTDKYAYSHEPFAINGASHHSGGTATFSADKIKNPECSPATKFFSEKNISFHKDLSLGNDELLPLSIQAFVYEAYLQALPLSTSRDANANHERQLELILINPGPNDDKLIAWAELFAEYHGLDLNSIIERARNKVVLFKRMMQMVNAHDWVRRYDINGSQDIPIRNVFEASIVVATLRSSQSSISLSNLVQRIASISIPNLVQRVAYKFYR